MRRLRRDDEAVTEVVGFVLSFALSAIFLLIAMSAFWTARANTDAAVSAVELKTIADRVATRVIEASLVAQEFPNSTLAITINIPQMVNGRDYILYASEQAVIIRTTDGTASATSTTFNLDAVPFVVVSGVVYSSEEVVVVTYRYIPSPDGIQPPTKDIRIQSEA